MPKPFQKLKNDLIYLAIRILLFFLDFFPYKILQKLGDGFGALAYCLAAGERRKTLQNLQMAYGREWSAKEIRRVALTVWKNAGRNLFEVLRWRDWTREQTLAQVASFKGMEHAEKAIRRGKGVLAVTAHLGNWELLAYSFASWYPGKVTVVARQLYDPRLDRLITELRRGKGVEVVQRGMALKGILAALKRDHLVGLLLDQDTGRDGVFVPFFNSLAWTQSGPARIARKTGAALIPLFITRNSDGRYEVHVEKEIKVPHTDQVEKDILETVRRYTEVIETFVRSYPGQWVWMHERWKTRPENQKS